MSLLKLICVEEKQEVERIEVPAYIDWTAWDSWWACVRWVGHGASTGLHSNDLVRLDDDDDDCMFTMSDNLPYWIDNVVCDHTSNYVSHSAALSSALSRVWWVDMFRPCETLWHLSLSLVSMSSAGMTMSLCSMEWRSIVRHLYFYITMLLSQMA